MHITFLVYYIILQCYFNIEIKFRIKKKKKGKKYDN